MTDTELIQQAVSTAHRVNALQLGSAEALADCRRRMLDAQLAARIALREPEDRTADLCEGADDYDPTDDEGGD